MSWWNRRDKFMEQVQEDLWNLDEKRFTRKGKLFSTEASDKTPIHRDINELKRIVRAIQKNGVSMWNYKAVIPQIFDVISGAFGVLEDLADEVDSLNTRVSELESKEKK